MLAALTDSYNNFAASRVGACAATSNPDAKSHTCTLVGDSASTSHRPHSSGLSAADRFAAVSAPSVPAQHLPQSQPIETRVTRWSHGTDLTSPHVCVPHGLPQSTAVALEPAKLIT